MLLKRINDTPVRAWALYDFANSSYVLIFQSFLLPVFFSIHFVENGNGLGGWGLVNGLSTLAGVVLALIAGSYADATVRLKVLKQLIFFSFFGMVVVSWAVGSNVAAVPYLYFVCNAIFLATISISDSALRFLSKDRYDVFRNSGVAWGFGYVGGIVALACVVLVQKLTGDDSAWAYLFVAIFYIFFSLFAIDGMGVVPLNSDEIDNSPDIVLNKSQAIQLLFGIWFVSEAIAVVLLFYSIYASTELQLSTLEVGATLLLVQLIAWPATVAGGRLIKKFSFPVMFGGFVLLWLVVVVLLATKLSTGELKYFILSLIVFLTGVVVGNSQSYLRALYALTSKRSEAGYQFGKYAVVSQAAASIGPITFGYASDYLNSQTIPLYVTGLFFFLGYILIVRVLPKGRWS